MLSPRARRMPGALKLAALAALGTVAVAALAGCNDEHDPLSGVERPASIEIDPATVELWAGDTAQLTATARRRSGEPIEGWPIQWSTSDAQVAAVNALGRVEARNAGTAIIKAESWGRFAEAEIFVEGYDLIYELETGSASTLHRLRFDDGEPVPLPVPGMRAADPVPSPDRRRIAFVGWVDASNAEIFVINRDGTGLTRLTHDPELDDQPTWSPDGQRIAFRSFREGRLGDIWVMNADGSDPVNLTPDPLPGVTDEARPAWSPDGNFIAYASNAGGDMDIWVMNADGSEPSRITDTPDFDTEPAWAPDGARIAFRRSSPGGGSDIAIFSFATGEVERIARDGEDRMPAWAPDGSIIAFVSQPTLGAARSDIFTMRPDGTEVEQRTEDAAPGLRLNPAWFRRP